MRTWKNIFAMLGICMVAVSGLHAATPTSVSFVLSPSGTSVAANTVVTLTASVTANSLPVTGGTVTFCEAPSLTGGLCPAQNVLGIVQLVSSGASQGTASWKFVPGSGQHNYIAAYNGTTAYSGSSSVPLSLSVSVNPAATTTSIASSGNASGYTLTSTVSTVLPSPNVPVPSGSVSFIDTTNSNQLLGTSVLGSPVVTNNFNASPTTAFSVGSGYSPRSLVAGDFNGDGRPDVAVVNYGSTSGNLGLTIMLGDGAGNLNKLITYATGPLPRYVAMGDFNGDGKLDLAVANYGDSTTRGTISIFLGDGTGHFAQAVGSPITTGQALGDGATSIAVGDFNGDGIQDFAVTDFGGASGVGADLMVFRGNGDGTFAQTPASPIRQITASYNLTALYAVAAGDFNNDGITDLVVLDHSSNSYVIILLGNGDGSFTPASTAPYAFGGNTPSSLVVRDFDGDGNADIAVACSSSRNVYILKGDGHGGLSVLGSPISLGVSGTPTNVYVAAGDFNNDGITDLAVSDGDLTKVSILLGTGGGAFSAASVLSSPPIATGVSGTLGQLAVGDFNSDGVPDIVLADWTSSSVSLLLNQLVATETATLTSVVLTGAGTHYVDAAYPSDTNFQASQSSTIPLTGVQIAISPTTLSNGTVGTSYLQNLMASGGFTGPYIYAVTSGSLPTGVSLTSGGVISGTPTTAGTYNFTVTATDSATAANGGPFTGSRAYTVTIAQAVLPNTSIVLTSTPNPSLVGQSVTFTATIPSGIAGTISFNDGGTVVTGCSNQTINTATGVATCTTSALANDIHSMTAVFTSTDGNYVSDVTSAAYSQGVNLQDLGSVNVSSSIATPVVESFLVPAGTTLGATPYQVLTRGAQNKDFTATSSQSPLVCVSQTYTSAQLCTVTINFSPTVSGSRDGAVALLDASGKAVATFYVYGVGMGPQVVFDPGTQTTVGSGLHNPTSIALDGDGNIYIVDIGNQRVLKAPFSDPTCSTPGNCTTVASDTSLSPSLHNPAGVAVDGAGNVYIADYSNGRILKVPPTDLTCSVATDCTTVGSGLSGPNGVAVDSIGNVYIANYGNNTVLKVPPSDPTCAVATDCTPIANDPGLNPSLHSPYNVTVDGLGNVYIADFGNNRVLRVPPSDPTCAFSCTTVGGSSLSLPSGVAVDAAGDVYIANYGSSMVLKVPPSDPDCSVGTCTTFGSGLANSIDVALDDAGNVYIADYSNNRALKVDCVDPPSLSFANTTVGSTSNDSPKAVTVANIGNALLTFPVPGVVTNPSISASFAFSNSSTCPIISSVGPSGALASGSSCLLAIDFVPTTVGSISGQAVLTDNNLNALAPAYTTQTIPLAGTGLPATQTITFPAPASPVTYGVTPITLTATASSGLQVTYTVTGPATLSGSALTITGVGTVTVTASQAGNAIYSAATSVSQTIVVNQAVLTVTADNLTRVFGAVNPILTYLITGYVNGDMSSVVSGAPVLSTTATASSPVGSYSITAAVGTLAATNYSFTFTNGTLAVIQATGANSSTTLTVSPATVQYGDTSTLTAVVSPAGATGTVTFTATPVGGGTTITLGTSTVANSGTAVLSENTLNAGTYNIVATYNGDPNIGGSASAPIQLTVVQRTAPGGGPALTVTANDASRTTTGSTPFSYTVSGTLVNGDTYATAVTGTPVYTAYSGSTPGSYPISITSGLTSTNYLITFADGTLTVVSTATTTTLSASPGSPQYGDPVTLTATVSPSAATGTASFYDGSVYLGDGTVSSGIAMLVTTTLDAGAHTITAIYNGDATYASSNSNPATVIVAKKTAPGGGPAVTITVQNVSRQYGTANPQFEYIVAGTLVNTDTYATAVTGVPVYAVAGDSPTLPANTVLTNAISVSGLASQNYEVAYVNGTLMVTLAPTVADLSESAGTVQYGDPVTLTATVTSGATGTVYFVNNSTVLGHATLLGGVATLTTSTLPAGNYAITAVYQGDGNYGSSTSDPVALTVMKRAAPDGSAVLTVIVNNASRTYSQGNPAFSYTVTGALINGDTYTNAVTGVPVYTTTATAMSTVGSYPISVNGLNSDNYVIVFVNGTLMVTQATPVVTVASSLNPSTYGQSVTFTATVPAGATGTVSFYDGSAYLGDGAVVGGTATYTTSALATGAHSITAAYLGDTNFNAATSAVLNQTVISKTILADFAITATPPLRLVAPGASISYTASLASVTAPFTNPVVLTATGLPPGATYAFTPALVVPGANGASSTFTVNVPQQSARETSGSGSRVPFVLAALLLPLTAWRRGRKKIRLLLVMLIAFAGFSTLIGCGAGGYFAQSQKSYTITITGTSGNLTHSTTITLTVE